MGPPGPPPPLANASPFEAQFAEMLRICGIFLPHIMKSHFAALHANTRLVHYTSVDSALKIAKSKELWLRSTKAMNDLSEVQHGLNALDTALSSRAGLQWKSVIESAHPPALKYIDEIVKELPSLVDRVYIGCVSEHRPDEDQFGRLSMWRAYGAPNSELGGAAIVVSMAPFRTVTDVFSAHSYPVIYGDAESMHCAFDEMSAALQLALQQGSKWDEEGFYWWIRQALIASSFCLKHRGFQEEREWRIVHIDDGSKKGLIERSVRPGHTELIFPFPLGRNPPESEAFSFTSLVEKVILGPSRNPQQARASAIGTLRALGFENAEAILHSSGIPLRVDPF